MRRNSAVARRQYTKYRRRRVRDAPIKARLQEAYRSAKRTLQSSIKETKRKCWEELLEILNEEPWGRSYLIVRNKLHTAAPPVMQDLHPRVLEGVVSALFPEAEDDGPFPDDHPPFGEEISGFPEVTGEEFSAVLNRLRAHKKAPGPDGILGRAWYLAVSSALGDRLMRLYMACLRLGEFPPEWKEGRVILLKKDGRPAEEGLFSTYRPICLLDEAGKILERIVAVRLVEHLKTEGPTLYEYQFGFREGRSTIDAVSRVKALSERTVAQGGGGS